MRHPDHSPNGYTFEVYGNEVIFEGRAHWPDCLSIVLDRRQAISLLAQLANGLQYPDKQEFYLSWCGQLEKTEDGNWPFGDIPMASCE